MVQSLVNLSLISITNGIQDGRKQHLQLLPPELRPLVLDMALKRGLVNDPKCSAVLSSVEFLCGMKSFSTEAGRIYDLDFLHRVIKSMATVSPNGETIGAAVRKLRFSVYGCACFVGAYTENERRVTKSSFPTVAKLIAACPNTVSLDLRGVESAEALGTTNGGFYHPWFPSILNERGACKRVMENLLELSVCGQWTKVLGSERPFLNFKRLTTLKLDNCAVQVDVWPKFLGKVPTLENLRMIDVNAIGQENDEGEYAEANATGLDWILPFPMPNLKSLEVISVNDRSLFECNEDFVDNLMGCPNLREVSLMLDEKSVDEKSLFCLASTDVALKLKARLILYGNQEAELSALDSSSRFKVVAMFHDRMDSFELFVSRDWNPQLTTALEDAVSTCSTLTTFRLQLPSSDYVKREIKSEEEAKKVNAALVQFFTNRDRALQLQDLSLIGSFDEAVMSALFDNCLNLRQLKISKCPDLRDQHLIDWAARGGGILTDLSIFECSNVTGKGITPILIKSAEGLLRINVNVAAAARTRRWQTVLGTHCPNAVEVNED